MLFNSLAYFCLFLPIVVLIFFVFNSLKLTHASTVWLILASLFFYSFWKLSYLPILLLSIAVNCVFGRYLLRENQRPINLSQKNRKYLLTLGIVFNVSLLGYFKYYDFFVINISQLLPQINLDTINIALPLGISFFTFQQIAYLVDCYRRQVKKHSVLSYFLFVSFFPQLVAGPIVHHKEMMPQFSRIRGNIIQWENVYVGLFLLGIGLFKKVVIADTFAIWVNQGYGSPSTLLFSQAWIVSMSYTIQLYFDFSGYTDMALGAARLFNIHLPKNFNSPYKALSIQDFWRRWHITLGRFLRNYLYIPLGGNKKGRTRTYLNLIITFLLGGIWHGAGWTFVAWGAAHATAICLHRLWQKNGMRLPTVVAWLITILFINTTWVLFRAPDMKSAITIISSMYTPSMQDLTGLFPSIFLSLDYLTVEFFIILLYVFFDLFLKNSTECSRQIKPNIGWAFITSVFSATGVLYLMNTQRYSEFLYFQF